MTTIQNEIYFGDEEEIQINPIWQLGNVLRNYYVDGFKNILLADTMWHMP